MKISEYITKLEKLRAEHGELEVMTYGAGSRAIAASTPVIAHKRILTGRESRPAFHHSFEKDETKGEKVIRV